MAHDVFISYAHTDKPTGDAVCATLEARGIRCWMAPRDVLPGVIYSGAIVEAIHASRVFVLVFSAAANISPHVMRELERAVHDGIPVLPLRIEDVPLSPSMEYFISTPHWLDALTPPLEKHLVQLAETVKVLLQRADAEVEAKRAAAPPSEAPPTVKAPAVAPAVAPPPKVVPPPAVARQQAPPAFDPEPKAEGEGSTDELVAGSASAARPEAPAAATQPARTAAIATASMTASQGRSRSIPPRAIAGVGALGVVLVAGVLVASTLSTPGPAASPPGSSDSGLGPSATASHRASPEVSQRPSPTARLAGWLPISDRPIERERATAQLLANGAVLVVGGIGPEGALASAELYDPATMTWTTTGSMTTARVDHTMTLLPNGTVLVAGGIVHPGDISPTNKPLASAEVYDPATGSWTVTGSMTARRSNHAAASLADGTVLVAGGFATSGEPQASAEIYDPSRGTWRAISSMSAGRWSAAIVRLADGRVLVAGSGGATTSSPKAELFDPHTRQWTKTGSMATGRAEASLTLLDDGRVLVVGGALNVGTGASTASSELFDPATGKWRATASMSISRTRHTATLLQDGSVLVAGGDGLDDSLATCERFDPRTETWVAAPSMATARAWFTATLLESGRVLVVGGAGTSELFDPGG